MHWRRFIVAERRSNRLHSGHYTQTHIHRDTQTDRQTRQDVVKQTVSRQASGAQHRTKFLTISCKLYDGENV